MSNSNPKIKTFTFPDEQGIDVEYDLAPQWENVENKPDVYTKKEVDDALASQKDDIQKQLDSKIITTKVENKVLTFELSL